MRKNNFDEQKLTEYFEKYLELEQKVELLIEQNEKSTKPLPKPSKLIRSLVVGSLGLVAGVTASIAIKASNTKHHFEVQQDVERLIMEATEGNESD